MSSSRVTGGPKVIALVASAGGLDAVRAVLEPLPAGFGGCVLVLIHQDPERLSRLPELLDAHCALDVAHAGHDVELSAGRVLVAPPGKHLLITPRSRTALIVSGAFPPSRPSADLLLSSMALSLGERAVDVVLSGGGSDGATGVTAIHEFGGWVIAADEASSENFSMPEAATARDDAVDEVLGVASMAARLVELAGEA